MRYPAAGFTSGSFVTILLLAAGCESTARYDVVAPAASRGEVPRNAGAVVNRDKIDYEIFQAEDKLIVRFVNRTGQLLKVAEQSVMLDAVGRSFAVETQEIAPDQSGRAVLPPAFAAERRRSVSIATEVEIGGVDEGGMIGSRRDIQNNIDDGGSAGSAAAPPAGFRWPAGSLARLRLVYHVGDSVEGLTHEWAIRRVR